MDNENYNINFADLENKMPSLVEADFGYDHHDMEPEGPFCINNVVAKQKIMNKNCCINKPKK